MYETARKYSEQQYYRKEDVMKEIDSYLVDPIWQEVKTYRSFFRKEIKLNEKPYYLIQNALVVKQTLYIEKMLLKCKESDCISYDNFMCSDLNDEENEQLRQYLQHLILHPQIRAKDFYDAFFKQFEIHDIYKDHLEFMLNEEEPFLLRLYSMVYIPSKRSFSLIYFSFLILQNMARIKNDFDFFAFANELNHFDEQDITYGYLEMLKRLQLILYKKMVLLNTDGDSTNLQVKEKELVERYPALKKEQIQFYVQHRTIGHYYTIQDYIRSCGVCYETARYSLDQLIVYQWYQKKKIGKKFVYYVV